MTISVSVPRMTVVVLEDPPFWTYLRLVTHNPNGADAVAAATKAADTARERAAEYLLATRLKQLREQATAQTEQAVAAPWTDRLPELAAGRLDADTSAAVIA
ncbi:hypothetical protein AB0K86_19725 [Streptomyces clavifer]|uniref:hypothetical protein n=1 Tax=Streptomyces TaxID=1883 RepID=UPI0006FD2844|nr:hypothetical protein [Streptomyces sp. Root55]KQZ12116.1 hypothetical protein ASD51_33680 [Streptomyces sp. Root55]